MRCTTLNFRLIPNIDLLEDDSPTTTKPQTITDAPKSTSIEDQESIQEPFSGDLQVVYVERESPIVTRKRRKLPEIPKSPRRRCKGLLGLNFMPLSEIEF